VRLSDGLQIPRSMELFAGHPIERHFNTLVTAWSAAEALGRFQASVALFEIIDWLLRYSVKSNTDQSGSVAANRERVNRTIDHVRKRIAKPVNAEELAGIAGVSSRGLTDLFRSVTGYAPLEYVRRLRVEHAKELLGNVDVSIKGIASRTGFEDQFHFSRVFHRIVGLSPSQYRHTALGGHRRTP